MKRILIPIFFLFFIFWNNISAQTTAQDSMALVNLYNSTDGPHWTTKTNWLLNSVGNWFGIKLSTIDHRVYRVSLSNNELTGELPESIGSLDGLNWLLLDYNNLTGSIPDTLSYLENLTILDLSDNQFSGALPEMMGNLVRLQSLTLDNNNLNGDLPDLSSIPGLGYLSVSSNKFTFLNLEASGLFPGDIPVFQYSPQDTILGVSKNEINGTVTVEIDNDEADYYKWYKNGLLVEEASQTIIPPGQGLYDCKVTNSKFPGLTLYSDTIDFNYTPVSDSMALVSLYNSTNGEGWVISNSWLTGDINTWFGISLDTDHRVSRIELINNSLKGILPPELTNLTHLVTLQLDSNQLTGELPLINLIDSLDNVSVKNNLFMFGDLSSSGVKPGDISSLIYNPQDTFPRLSYDLYDVTLTVNDVADTNNVYSWYLDGTLIDDSTRTIVINTEGLYNCEVANTVYTGMVLLSDTFDFSFSLTTDSIALVHLYNEAGGAAWTNKTSWLTGRLTTWYGVHLDGFNRVDQLILSRNKLLGPIPYEIGNLTHLKMLDLNNNQLSGEIPSEICNVTVLSGLRLFHNNLSGKIPAEIGNLTLLAELSLESNGLTDIIPEEIGNCTKLGNLNLSNNNLAGVIPTEIGNLTLLSWLALNDNQLSGAIPIEIGNLPLLTGIEIDDNKLTGSIPLQIFDLNNLIYLSLNDNKLSGPIPNDIKDLTHLNFLALSTNQFTGKIPVGFGDLTELTDLLLNDNQLSDTIPPEIGYLTSLNTLDLSGNQLVGSLPVELENLKGLVNLYLDSNLFIGDMPLLSDFSYLSELSVNDNQFTFSNLTSSDILPDNIDDFNYAPQDTVFGLQYVFLAGTLTVLDDGEAENEYTWYRDAVKLNDDGKTIYLTGEGRYSCEVDNPLFPELTLLSDTFSYSYTILTDSIALVELYNKTNGGSWTNKTNWLTGHLNSWYGITLDGDHRVSKIALNSNNLTDTIPPEIGNLSHMKVLNLQSNKLAGHIPVEVGGLDSITDLRLNGNLLSGNIPPIIGNLTKLMTLYLDNNQFTGGMPSAIGNLVKLTYLALHSNQLEGVIPTQLGNLTLLQTLNLSKNNLTGSIPVTFSNFVVLQNLQLSNNRLTGNIPSDFEFLVAVRTINLSDNLLSGQIPEELASLDNLMNLNISGNNFSGSIPDDLGYLSSFQNFNVSDNAYHFINLEPIFDWTNYDDFKTNFFYYPQADIGNEHTMKGYLSMPLEIDVEGYISGEYDKFQWYKNDVLLVGKTDSVLVIPSFAENDTGIYHCEVTNDIAILLTLKSYDITVESGNVPDNYTLNNVTFGNDDTNCFGAALTITLAGGGTTVIFGSGSSVTLIAGQSIRFLPGFHAVTGSYMDAYITTEGSFCDSGGKSIVMSNYSSKNSSEKQEKESKDIQVETVNMKIFPNPNDGRFTIELKNFTSVAEICVYNMTGSEMYRIKTNNQTNYHLNIQGIDRGVYFVKVQSREVQITKKIIIR